MWSKMSYSLTHGVTNNNALSNTQVLISYWHHYNTERAMGQRYDEHRETSTGEFVLFTITLGKKQH